MRWLVAGILSRAFVAHSLPRSALILRLLSGVSLILAGIVIEWGGIMRRAGRGACERTMAISGGGRAGRLLYRAARQLE